MAGMFTELSKTPETSAFWGKKKKEAEQDKQQEKQSFSSDSSSDTCKLCYVSISFSIKWKLKLHKQPCEVKWNQCFSHLAGHHNHPENLLET